MITNIVEKNYKYKHPLATLIVDEVTIGVSQNGRRSLSAAEVERLSGLAAFQYFQDNYRRALNNEEFTISPAEAIAIMAFLKVNQTEFGILIGCKKAKISKILRGKQPISRPQALLVLERLGMEIGRPGSIRKIIGDKDTIVKEAMADVTDKLNKIRFDAA
ncbi:MAG: helix-turn-helix domain-containing protein [Oligoflexales bacterium]|nr:helix-turn-helix domain-containing protein [Oligoflexales bacterium]